MLPLIVEYSHTPIVISLSRYSRGQARSLPFSVQIPKFGWTRGKSPNIVFVATDRLGRSIPAYARKNRAYPVERLSFFFFSSPSGGPTGSDRRRNRSRRASALWRIKSRHTRAAHKRSARIVNLLCGPPPSLAPFPSPAGKRKKELVLGIDSSRR